MKQKIRVMNKNQFYQIRHWYLMIRSFYMKEPRIFYFDDSASFKKIIHTSKIKIKNVLMIELPSKRYECSTSGRDRTGTPVGT